MRSARSSLQQALVEHHFSGWNQVAATLMLQTCVATRTSTLRLGTGVMVLPWHNPVLLAEQAATLDVISGGRVDLGVGKGYRYSEFRGFNLDQREADARDEEALEVPDNSVRFVADISVIPQWSNAKDSADGEPARTGR